MIGFLTPLADNGISFSFGFVFAGTNLTAALITWFFLYESRTLSLEHVDLMYAQPDIKPWTSHKWVPPGYITRRKRNTGLIGGAETKDSTDGVSHENITHTRKERV